MKKYIILTANIHPIGGMQLYSSGKAKYLEKEGWAVSILYNGNPLDDFQIEDLKKYNDGAFPVLSLRPNYLPSYIVNHTIKKIKKHISYSVDDYIYVESHSDLLAIWGELIAKELSAKHVCFNCNEVFRGSNKFYVEYIDFFWYKYLRRELIGLHKDTLSKLFDGYYSVEASEEFVFDAIEPEPIQDVNMAIEIDNCDYNIAYLGRTTKGYVPNIIKGVSDFAKKYPQKKINFIIIGDTKPINDFLKEKIGCVKNVILTLTGDLVPIPRKIFSHIDLMIAGAVCAEISAREGVPTLVADCENYLCNGVLGYTINNSMYYNSDIGQTSFLEGIEQVLVLKIHEHLPYLFPDSPNPDDIFKKHFKFFEDGDNERKYYCFQRRFAKKMIVQAIIKGIFKRTYFRIRKKKKR